MKNKHKINKEKFGRLLLFTNLQIGDTFPHPHKRPFYQTRGNMTAANLLNPLVVTSKALVAGRSEEGQMNNLEAVYKRTYDPQNPTGISPLPYWLKLLRFRTTTSHFFCDKNNAYPKISSFHKAS